MKIMVVMIKYGGGIGRSQCTNNFLQKPLPPSFLLIEMTLHFLPAHKGRQKSEHVLQSTLQYPLQVEPCREPEFLIFVVDCYRMKVASSKYNNEKSLMQ